MTFLPRAFLVLLLAAAMAQAGDNAKLGLLYFSNSSGFKHGKWRIEQDVPKFLLGHLMENKASFVSFDKIQEVLGKHKSKELIDNVWENQF